MAIKAPLVVSVNVGQSQTYGTEGAEDPMDRPWTSAIFKSPVEGPVMLSSTGLEGDGQAEKGSHGGHDMAVLGYSAEHYPSWKEELGKRDLKYGAFGENFTITRETEETVCIGDIYTVGDARIQIGLPRQPCWKLNRRHRLADMVERVHRNTRGGWYFRVLTEGYVERGNFVVLEDRPCPDWSVARAYTAFINRQKDPAEARALAGVEPLAADWKKQILE